METVSSVEPSPSIGSIARARSVLRVALGRLRWPLAAWTFFVVFPSLLLALGANDAEGRIRLARGWFGVGAGAYLQAGPAYLLAYLVSAAVLCPVLLLWLARDLQETIHGASTHTLATSVRRWALSWVALFTLGLVPPTLGFAAKHPFPAQTIQWAADLAARGIGASLPWLGIVLLIAALVRRFWLALFITITTQLGLGAWTLAAQHNAAEALAPGALASALLSGAPDKAQYAGLAILGWLLGAALATVLVVLGRERWAEGRTAKRATSGPCP